MADQQYLTVSSIMLPNKVISYFTMQEYDDDVTGFVEARADS
jgi:hypothetical protein